MSENEFDDYETLVDGVKKILEKWDYTSDVLQDIHINQLNGEDINNSLGGFFDNNQELVEIAIFSYQFDLDSLTSEAVKMDMISESERKEFLSIWEEIDWIKPVAQAKALSLNNDSRYWTDKSLNVETMEDGSLMVEHDLEWGYNNVHSIRLPLEVFLEDSIGRIIAIKDWFEDLDEDVLTNIDPKLVKQLGEISEKATTSSAELEEEVKEITNFTEEQFGHKSIDEIVEGVSKEPTSQDNQSES